MTYSTTITKKGQITIPKHLRQFLELKENSKVILEPERGKKVVRIKPAVSILELAGKFKPKKIESALNLRKKMSKLYSRK